MAKKVSKYLTPKYIAFFEDLSVPEIIGLRGKNQLKARGYTPKEIEEVRKGIIKKARKHHVQAGISKYY